MRSLHFFIAILSFILTACASQSTIVNDVEERDANEIIVYLASKGINATKVASSGGAPGAQKVQLWNIEVPADERIKAMVELNAAGLPKKQNENLLQLFSNSGLVPSATQEQIRYRAGLAQQIANTIRKFDGIIDASVIISFPETNPLTGVKSGPITASVYVKHNGVLDDPNSYLREKIRRLVAASVTGLKYDNVTLIASKAASPAPYYTQTNTGETKPLEEIWSMMIAQESVPTFHLIFFSFILALTVLLILLIWGIWKLRLYFKTRGIKDFFNLHPIVFEKKESVENEEEKALEPHKKEEKDEDQGHDIDDI